MKPSLMSMVYLQFPGATLRGMLDFARKEGIDGIDVVQPQALGMAPQEFGQWCAEAGLAVVGGIVFDSIREADFTRAKWLETARRGIEATVAAGARKVMFPTGGVPGRARGESRRLWLELLSEAVEMGARMGVSVSIESFAVDIQWSPFVSSRDLLEAVAAVPGLKVTFDSGNHFVVEDVLEAYRRLAPHIVHVHLKDWEILDEAAEKALRMEDGRWYRMVPLGRGVVDNAGLLRAMQAAGETHYFDLEYSGQVPMPEGLRESWANMKAALAMEGRK